MSLFNSCKVTLQKQPKGLSQCFPLLFLSLLFKQHSSSFLTFLLSHILSLSDMYFFLHYITSSSPFFFLVSCLAFFVRFPFFFTLFISLFHINLSSLYHPLSLSSLYFFFLTLFLFYLFLYFFITSFLPQSLPLPLSSKSFFITSLFLSLLMFHSLVLISTLFIFSSFR
ncbi:unnamed protein product [Acanthosepion pharaonis]|uniref:Uncharacterized protein n=1 Tax=Acanthosepion pharaonis TaxID=158019 RepID=A0A812ALX0_ACAPH|nr:unnamed protein product [Sepia pharaonis]